MTTAPAWQPARVLLLSRPFPALIFMLALVSFFPVSDLPGRLAGHLASVAPPEVATIVRDQLAQLWQSRHGGLLTFGFIAALWTSSAALVALIDTLDRVYHVEDSRPWWKQRLTAILLTIGLAVFILASATLVTRSDLSSLDWWPIGWVSGVRSHGHGGSCSGLSCSHSSPAGSVSCTTSPPMSSRISCG